MSSHDGADQAAWAARLGCAALVDAMGRLHGHRAHILALSSPDPTRPLFGPAATVAFLPHRDDLPQSKTDFGEFFYQAVGDDPGGKVLVLSSGGYRDASHGGGVKLSRIAHHGLAGVLADGRLRDFAELRDHGFATWCRGEATHWGGDTVMPYAAGVAVEVAGVCVVPGDYVYADRTGAVVIPHASLERVLQEADRVEAEDADFAARVARERPPA
ncbi:RraA family protein [Streptomyces sp. NPDC026673]|uniref:RraA family protein n=1 Tax=Streptomyces sp. NPDC026673 TaxID=3155724 RepID=UPI0033E06F94